MDNYYTRVRGYGSTCERALFADNAPVSVYDKLIEAVHSGLPTMRRYLELRRRVLGLKELNMYDLYCPIVADVDMKIPYADAQKLVKEATKPLGEEYGKLLDRAFSERWIDVYENKGKTTGAYSCGVYGVHPYVLLNYSDKLDDRSHWRMSWGIRCTRGSRTPRRTLPTTTTASWWRRLPRR